MSDRYKMATFDKHLESIANALTVDVETSNYLQKDFGVIRKYIIDILRKDPIFGPVLIDSITSASNFNCSLIFDFSRYIPLGATTTKYPSFIKIGQRGRCKIDGMQDLPFFSNGINIAGGIVTSIVRGLITQGLDFSGYFVRGHMDDIYELELINEIKSGEYNQNHWDSEWQTSYIMLLATTEEITMQIRLRVLLKFCSNEQPRDFMPHPTHRLKMIWLAAADVRYLEYFTLCAPLSERELAASPVNLFALRLLLVLLARIKLNTLKRNHLESVSYELIYTKAQKGASMKETVASVIMAILKRMIEYFNKNYFPYYWDTNRNFLLALNNHANKIYTHNRLRDLFDKIKNMRHNKEISYEDVEYFLGVQINSQTYNVDDFGIYISFTQP